MSLLATSLSDVGWFGLEGYFYRTSSFVPATLPAQTTRSGWGIPRPIVRQLSMSKIMAMEIRITRDEELEFLSDLVDRFPLLDLAGDELPV